DTAWVLTPSPSPSDLKGTTSLQRIRPMRSEVQDLLGRWSSATIPSPARGSDAEIRSIRVNPRPGCEDASPIPSRYAPGKKPQPSHPNNGSPTRASAKIQNT